MKKLGLIDRVPPIVRHLLILLVPPLLAWLASDVVPALDGQGGWVAVAAGVLGGGGPASIQSARSGCSPDVNR